MKGHLRFIVASLLCAPLLVLLFLLLIGFSMDALFGRCPDAIADPVLQAVWWGAEFPVPVFLALGGISCSVFTSWFHRIKSRVEITFLGFYSFVLAFYTGYLGWWHATGKVFDL